MLPDAPIRIPTTDQQPTSTQPPTRLHIPRAVQQALVAAVEGVQLARLGLHVSMPRLHLSLQRRHPLRLVRQRCLPPCQGGPQAGVASCSGLCV